jgi:hypothetical protein
MIAKLKGWWRAHGTKILGVLVAAVGVAGDCLVYIQAMDPKHAAIYSAFVAIGGAIIRRGFTNSARLPEVLPPPVTR